MNDFGILIPTCALALVCGGLIVVALVLGFRFVGGSLPGFLGGAEEDKVQTVPRGRPRPNLRAQADALDFDAAVARHAGENSPATPESPDFKAQRIDAPADPPLSDSYRRRRKRRDRNEDEIFGGMLDDDGDGSVDF